MPKGPFVAGVLGLLILVGAMLVIAEIDQPELPTDLSDPGATDVVTSETVATVPVSAPATSSSVTTTPPEMEASMRVGVTQDRFDQPCREGWGLIPGGDAAETARRIRNWGIDTVRVPISGLCWFGTPGPASTTTLNPATTGREYREAIASWISVAEAEGLTVVVQGRTDSLAAARHRQFWSDMGALGSSSLIEVGAEADAGAVIDFLRMEGFSGPVLLDVPADASTGDYALLNGSGEILLGVPVAAASCGDAACWSTWLAEGPVPIVLLVAAGDDCDGSLLARVTSWALAASVPIVVDGWHVLNGCASGDLLVDEVGHPSPRGSVLLDQLAASRSASSANDATNSAGS